METRPYSPQDFKNRPSIYGLGTKSQFKARRSTEIIGFGLVAERQGFEPWKDLHPCRFSRPVHSTTLPSLHCLVNYFLIADDYNNQKTFIFNRIESL